MAASAIGLWSVFGVVMSTRSTAGSATSARQSPVERAKPSEMGGRGRGHLLVDVGENLHHRHHRQVEDARRGMEARANGCGP